MSLRSLILDQFWLKLFSLALATLIWLAVKANLENGPLFAKKAGPEDLRTFISRPILILTESSDHIPLTVLPERATVTVRGPAELLQGLKEDDVDVFVRLSDPREVPIDLPVHVHVPAGATSARITPITALVKPAATVTPTPTPGKPASPP